MARQLTLKQCERLNKAVRTTRGWCCRAGSLDHCERLRGVVRAYYQGCPRTLRVQLPDVPWATSRRGVLKGCR